MIDVRFRRTQAMAAMLQDFYTEPSSPPTIAAPLAGAWPSFKADNAALEPSARKDLLAAIPHLRAFAISLTSDRDRADDLLQDTIVRALSQFARFEPGTNLRAWMFTILRNQFYSNHRRRHREVEDADGLFAARLSTLPEQDGHLDICDLGTALAQLSPEQRGNPAGRRRGLLL